MSPSLILKEELLLNSAIIDCSDNSGVGSSFEKTFEMIHTEWKANQVARNPT
jgi:hypothetical protein